jgi:hypothetical protein
VRWKAVCGGTAGCCCVVCFTSLVCSSPSASPDSRCRFQLFHLLNNNERRARHRDQHRQPPAADTVWQSYPRCAYQWTVQSRWRPGGVLVVAWWQWWPAVACGGCGLQTPESLQTTSAARQYGGSESMHALCPSVARRPLPVQKAIRVCQQPHIGFEPRTFPLRRECTNRCANEASNVWMQRAQDEKRRLAGDEDAG